MYYIVSMTTKYCLNNNKQPQALFSLLLKLVNGSTHGDATRYACVCENYEVERERHNTQHCFHDYYIWFQQQQIASGIYYFTPSNLRLMEMKLGKHVYDTVSMTTAYCFNNNKQFQAFTSSLFKLPNGTTHGGETWYACVLYI